MPDDIELLLGGTDGKRALPDGLRARLERTLVERSGAIDTPPELIGIDEPRVLPAGARAGLEQRMAAAASELLADVDAPRELPAPVRARLERALAPAPQRQAMIVRALAVAATVTLLAAGTLTVARNPREGALPPATTVEALPGSNTPPAAPLAQGPTAQPAFGEPLPPPPAFPGSGTGASSPGGDFPAPPFAYGDAVAQSFPAAATSGGASSTAPPRAIPPPVQIGIVGGDPQIEAGFRAYVRELNGGGGVRGARLSLVQISASQPSLSTAATVNLSAQPIASSDGPPSWAKAPLLETITATESVLRGDVFGFSSAPERQGHLIADRVFPDGQQGGTAIIYLTGGAPFDGAVPDAIEDVLRARGVTPIRVVFDPSAATTLFVPGDAAFLSMDAAASMAWLSAANEAGYAPPRGVGTIYPALDEAARAPTGRELRAISPYVFAGPVEMSALRERAGRVTARTIHGWVSAKMLAMAMWLGPQRGAETLAASLDSLRGYGNGFAPGYAVRTGTRSRIPEGLEMKLTDQGVTFVGGFLIDPF